MNGWEGKTDIGTGDVEFKTPRWLAELCVAKVMHLLEIRGQPVNIIDPAAGDGVFYRAIYDYMMHTNINLDWTFKEFEITQGTDFYQQKNEYCDVLIGNPPFTNLSKWLQHSAHSSGMLIAYILPAHGLNNQRLEMMESFGWRLQSIHSFPNPKEWNLGYPHFFCIWVTGERRWFGSHVLSDCLNGPAKMQTRLIEYE